MIERQAEVHSTAQVASSTMVLTSCPQSKAARLAQSALQSPTCWALPLYHKKAAPSLQNLVQEAMQRHQLPPAPKLCQLTTQHCTPCQQARHGSCHGGRARLHSLQAAAAQVRARCQSHSHTAQTALTAHRAAQSHPSLAAQSCHCQSG